MATILEMYQKQKKALNRKLSTSKDNFSEEDFRVLHELIYRTHVLENLQFYCKTAPESKDTKELFEHYKMFDAYVELLLKEHKCGIHYQQDLAENVTTEQNFNNVIKGYRKSFSSFMPKTTESFKDEILRQITLIIPVWIKYRSIYINFNKVKMEVAK